MSDDEYEFRRCLGLAFMAKGDYDRGIKVRQEALAIQPSSERCWMSLCNAYEAKGDYDAIIGLSETTLANNQLQEEFLRHSLFSAYEKIGQYAVGITTFQSVVDRHPKNWIPWAYLPAKWRS
jgi:tetratricopeptide (TPR) repeat protein